MNYSITNIKIKLYNYSIIFVSAFPLLGLKNTVLAILLFSLLSIYVFITEKNYRKIKKKDIINIFVLSSYYLLLIISFFISSDKETSLKLLEQNSSFLIFPLLLVINKNFIYESTLRKSLIVFVISNLILAIYVWYNISLYGITKAFNENTYYYPILRLLFNRLTGIHLPYLGMLFIFSSLIITRQLLQVKKIFTIKNIFFLLVLMFLLISVFTFAARQSIVLFFLIFSGLIFFNIKNKLKKTLFFLIIILLTTPLFYMPNIQNRIKEITEAKLILPTKGQASDQVNFRYGIYNCTFELIKQNWIIGVGPENIQKRLNECYSCYTYKNFDDFQHKSYNTHNQFFDMFLKFGLFGLFWFIIYLFWGIRYKFEYYYIFIILSVLSMLTENILDRQVGIVFFNFFNSMFFVQYLNDKDFEKINIVKKRNEESINS